MTAWLTYCDFRGTGKVPERELYLPLSHDDSVHEGFDDLPTLLWIEGGPPVGKAGSAGEDLVAGEELDFGEIKFALETWELVLDSPQALLQGAIAVGKSFR